MKQLYFFVMLCLTSAGSMAQISLTQSDFASAGDNILVSHADVNTQVDLTITGANQAWDFSSLVPQKQDTSSFLSVGSTGGTYSIYFANVSFNSNRSNIARAEGNIPAIPNLPITLSDPYSFYYKSSTDYKQQGLGITISGIQTPISFSSKDILYSFPVNYNNADSCNAAWNFSVPNLGYYGFTQKRVNHVDGWGSLTTPYGTFSVLRMKTTLAAHDTLYADTLGFGFGMDRELVTEYKWFGQNQLIPLLQINTTNMSGFETVTDIIYRDSVRTNVGISQPYFSAEVNVVPNPSEDYFVVQITSSKSQQVELIFADVSGAVVYRETVNTVAGNNFKRISTQRFAAGVYALSVVTNSQRIVKKVVVK